MILQFLYVVIIWKETLIKLINFYTQETRDIGEQDKEVPTC